MPNPPCKTLINPDELFGRRDLQLQTRSETQHLNLMRLCADFNFSVLQLQRKIFSHLSRKMVPDAPEFVLATYDGTTGDWYSMTPGMPNLKMLNSYAKDYEVDILHMHLFGEEDNYNLSTQNVFY
jgi:hypothetical protein